MRRLAIALLAAFALGYLVGASDSAGSSSAGHAPLSTVGVAAGPEPLPGAPEALNGAGLPGTALSTGAPEPEPSGAPTPGTTAPPPETWTRQGIVNWATEGHGPAYLALPIGRGHRVVLCGPGGCLTLVSTDAGPDLERQRAGRIADLAVGLWERLSGVPRGYGGFVGTWTVVE